MRDPPHRREPESLTNLTSQGYSFFSAGCPPTILLSLLLGTPHTHGASALVLVVDGWAVVVGVGFGGMDVLCQMHQGCMQGSTIS